MSGRSFICLTMSTASVSQRSLLVTLAAQAMSSVGFSVSILAWLVLSVVPLPKQEPPVIPDKKTRRRSAPAALPTQAPRRDSLTPSLLTSQSPKSPSILDSPARTRRVYFADSPTTPSRPVPSLLGSSNEPSDKPLPASPQVSPNSSSSTLVHPYTTIATPTLETFRESALESDSSSTTAASPRRPLALSRPFQKATRHSSGSPSIVEATVLPGSYTQFISACRD
ncbi:unnamed protein product [Mycena citricolor]|uniref:Uncharacterized protein n=1 Tax=Mycena citricolor TaxID=2018698 RepID=A0AAD2HTP7_9AGAR|nr:unnamed protein product [Mycena citricolor]